MQVSADKMGGWCVEDSSFDEADAEAQAPSHFRVRCLYVSVRQRFGIFMSEPWGDCRLIYNRVPRPRQIQILVQVWKQLLKWR